MDVFLDVLLLVVFITGGAYSFWTVAEMRRGQALRPNKFWYPTNCAPAECEDPEGFKVYMRPRILAFGILCLLTAATFFGGSYLSFCPKELVWVAFVLGVGAVGLHLLAVRKAGARFW